MLTGPAPGSTVRWSLHMIGNAPLEAHEWHWYQAQTVSAQGGYFTSIAQLWRGEQMVAWSEQLGAIFDKKSTS